MTQRIQSILHLKGNDVLFSGKLGKTGQLEFLDYLE